MEDNKERNEIFSRRLKAGKRTYFFDVKSTRSNDYYLTLTESTKKYRPDGTFGYEKHKIFLYKEDFDKFTEVLEEAINYIKSELLPDVDFEQFRNNDRYREPSEVSEAAGDDDQLKWD